MQRVFAIDLPSNKPRVPGGGPLNPTTTFLLALVTPCKTVIRNAKGLHPHYYMSNNDARNRGPEDVIDTSAIRSLAARVVDPKRGEYVFVEKPGSFEWMAPDRDLESVEAALNL